MEISTAEFLKDQQRPEVRGSAQYLALLVRILFNAFLFMHESLQYLKSKGAILSKPPSHEEISKQVEKLSKTPKHISAILEVKDINTADTQRLISHTADFVAWSIAAGIPVASVYERHGVVKKHEKEIYEAICLRLQNLPRSKVPKVVVHVNTCRYPSSTGESEQEPTEKAPFSLYLISEDDGREQMAKLADEMARRVHDGQMELSEISVELVQTKLLEATMPAPQLVIVFAPHLKLCGFPPWHLRLSEVFTTSETSGFHYSVFIDGLRDYASAEMRYGK